VPFGLDANSLSATGKSSSDLSLTGEFAGIGLANAFLYVAGLPLADLDLDSQFLPLP
jgi:hypothetical protein